MAILCFGMACDTWITKQYYEHNKTWTPNNTTTGIFRLQANSCIVCEICDEKLYLKHVGLVLERVRFGISNAGCFIFVELGQLWREDCIRHDKDDVRV